MNLELTIEQLEETLGTDSGEFMQVINIANDMIDNIDKYTGQVAAKTAARLSAYRVLISAKASFYKTSGSDLSTRKRKNTLISIEHSMEEMINTLKLLGRNGMGI